MNPKVSPTSTIAIPKSEEFERLFGIPARTMESYEQGLHNVDAAMRALLRIIDREPNAARRALAL
jgi:putative transcriptional regulator